MKRLALLLLSGCSDYGARSYDCDGDVDAALVAVVDRWPDVADVANRLDVFCETHERIAAPGRCARDVAACTPWIGTDTFRARVYIADDVDVTAALMHEGQHWHLWSTGACPTHTPDCGWIE